MKQKNKLICKIILCSILLIIFCINSYAEEQKINNVNENVNLENMTIYSEAAILIEKNTGKILYEKSAYDRKYPASTTKILTAIIALEKCDLAEKAVASENAIHSIKSGYSIANIQVGEEFSIKQLLEVMMIHSANEAANIIAEHISGSVEEFSKLMNEKAKEIGCLDSNFVNPNGMHDDNHYSTAYDMAMIQRYCMQNISYREIITLMQCSLPFTELYPDNGENQERTFKNTNNLMINENKYYYPYCNGGKTGFTTPAKNCLVTSCYKNGFELISVVLHAETTADNQSARYLDTINLLNYGYDNFDKNDIYNEYNYVETKEVSAEVENDEQELNDNELKSAIQINENGKIEEKNEELYSYCAMIVTGLIILIFVSIYFRNNRKKGKHAKDNLYKFNLL